MSFRYPVDVNDLVRRAKKRGDEFVRRSGLRDDLRDDEKLRAITDWVSSSWFPLSGNRTFHDAIDLGLPKVKGDLDQDYENTPVFPVSTGDVLFVQEETSDEHFEQGRVIFKHATPEGKTFYVQYRHLTRIQANRWTPLAGDKPVGYVGWHGDFPHVSVSAASLERIGDESTLGPSCRATAIPIGEAAWGVNCVEVDSFDPHDWPIEELSNKPGYLYDAIEIIRFCLKEPYRHFIGPGAPDSVRPMPRLATLDLNSTKRDYHVAELLSHPALREIPELLALAQDPNFKPLERAAQLGGKLVMAIQDALHACKFSVGRTGPDPDKPGKDGTFGDATERALAEFQKKHVKPLVDAAKSPSLFANLAAKVRTDGKLDWLTLHALDALARALGPKPTPTPKPTPVAAPPPPPQPAPAPSAPGPSPQYSNTFDARQTGVDNLSVHFGVRMYKAFLGDPDHGRPSWIFDGSWDKAEAKKEEGKALHEKTYHGKHTGVGYSSCNAEEHYTKKNGSEEDKLDKDERILSGKLGNEWPELGIASLRAKSNGNDVTATVGTKSYPVYRVWMGNWVGTNYTNCCNSQLAAMACALAEGKDGTNFSIVGGEEYGTPRGAETTTTYSMISETKKIETNAGKINVISVFEALFVSAGDWKVKKPGSTVFDDRLFGKIGTGQNEKSTTLGLSAIVRFGMAEALFTLLSAEQTDANYLKILIGDQGATSSHSWMVGDVRYGIWLEGQNLSQVPKLALDQSSFIGKDATEGYPFEIKSNGMDAARKEAGKGPGGKATLDLASPLSREDCTWLLDSQNEAQFKSRIAALLAKDPTTNGTGQAGTVLGKKVAKIKVIAYRCLSANVGPVPADDLKQAKRIAHSEYHLAPANGKYQRDDELTAEKHKYCGITCSWRRPNGIAIVRYYKMKP